MEILQWCKMQVIALIILVYVGTIHIRDGANLNKITKKSNCNVLFDILFIVAELAVLFDGITACTVNYLDRVPSVLNSILHLFMFITYELFIILMLGYWMSVTLGIPNKKLIRSVCGIPGLIIILCTIIFIPELRYEKGRYTNYSMGISVYICFATVVIFFLLTMAVVIAKHRYIPERKKKGLLTTLVFTLVIFLVQIFFPESLVSSIAIAMIMVSIFLNMENPSIHALEHYHNEMVMGFSNLVENKDDNTGGHIRRSSAYATLIAENLRKNPKYKNIITRDYLSNLKKAAPMHDVGKIGIPDAILQKKGKLTDEEYTKMKEHSAIGGKIIKETFGHLFDEDFENMAYQVAMYHHEKWNGKGYPEKISGTDIPLCARIMSVADVFDAVSAKRCYRDAMPLEECYEIIDNGSGTDFDPDIVYAFMMDKAAVEAIYHSNS